MGAFPRDRFKARTLAVVLLNTSLTLACGTMSPLSPSPIIIPDAVTVGVGAAQVFSVQNATVQQFNLSADHQHWSNCVAVDEDVQPGEQHPADRTKPVPGLHLRHGKHRRQSLARRGGDAGAVGRPRRTLLRIRPAGS